MKRKEQLISNRLILMPLRNMDLMSMLEIIKDERVNKTYILPNLKTKEEEITFYNRLILLSKDLDRFIYGIYYNDLLIGFINEVDKVDDEIELGYFISPTYWKHGFATEALKLAINTLFEMGYNKVLAAHFEDNIASARVMQKCGMVLMNKKETIEYNGISHKCIYYEINKYMR